MVAGWITTSPQALINPAVPYLWLATFGYIALKLLFIEWLALFIPELQLFLPSDSCIQLIGILFKPSLEELGFPATQWGVLLHKVRVSILHTQVLHSGNIKKERSETDSLIKPFLNLRMNRAWIIANSRLLYLTWAANNHDCPSAVNAKVQSFPMVDSSAPHSE